MLSRFFSCSSQEKKPILPTTTTPLLEEIAECLAQLEKAFSKYKSQKRYSTPYRAKMTLNYSVLLGMVVGLSVLWAYFRKYEGSLEALEDKRESLSNEFRHRFNFETIPNSDLSCKEEERFFWPCWKRNMIENPFCQALYDQYCPELNDLNGTINDIHAISIPLLLGGVFGTLGTVIIFFVIISCMLEQRRIYQQQLNSIKPLAVTLQDCVNEGLLTTEEVNSYQGLAQRLDLQTNKSMMELIADLKAKKSEIILKRKERLAFLSGGLDSNKETMLYNFFKNSQGSEKEMIKHILSFADLNPAHKV